MLVFFHKIIEKRISSLFLCSGLPQKRRGAMANNHEKPSLDATTRKENALRQIFPLP